MSKFKVIISSIIVMMWPVACTSAPITNTSPSTTPRLTLPTAQSQNVLEGIYYFADLRPEQENDCFDFIRFYTDGLLVAQDVCISKEIPITKVWQGLREVLQRDEIAFGPWRGSYHVDDSAISGELRKSRGAGQVGELLKYYEGTYVNGVLILDGKQYNLCIECEAPLP